MKFFPLHLTPQGWRFDRSRPIPEYAPDLDIGETLELDPIGRMWVRVAARLERETVTAEFCLDTLLWPVEDGFYERPANQHLNKAREKVVRRARAIVEIGGRFEVAMAVLEVKFRRQAVPA